MQYSRTTEKNILFLSLFVCAFILALKQIYDVDTLLHLSMGKLFWTLKTYPATEPFCYPAEGAPFLYTSWLFATIGYLFWKIAGPIGLSIAVAVVCTLLAWLLYADSRQPKSHGAVMVNVLIVFCALMLAEDRFIFRPELVTSLSFAVMVLLLGRSVFGGDRRLIWLLPVVTLLWGNSHSSVILMFLPFGAFAVYLAVELVMALRTERTMLRGQLVQLVLVGVVAFAAALLNPNGLVQFQYGQMVMGTEWYKQGIVELLPPGRRELLIIWPVFVVSAVTSVLALRRRAIPYLLISIGLLYVSLQAVRFYEFYCLMQAPIIARSLALLVGDRLKRLETLPICVALLVLMLTGAALQAGGIYPFQRDAISHERFGVGFRLEVDHEKAVAFLRDNGIRGRVFNVFEDGQSIIWYGWPELTVFIDGRGAIPEEMLESYSRAFSSPAMLGALQQQFGFETILIRRNLAFETNPHGAKAYFQDPEWSLVYFDKFSYLFLRNQGPYAGVIAKHRFNYVLANGDIGTYLEFMSINPDYARGLIADLERVPVALQTESDRLLLGYSHFKVGAYQKALEVLTPVRNYSGPALLLYGHTLRALGRSAEALAVYQEGAGRYKTRDFEAALQEVGTAQQAGQRLQQAVELMGSKDYVGARKVLQELLAVNPRNVAVLANLAYCSLNEGQLGDAEARFREALAVQPDYDVALYGLGLTSAGQGNVPQAKEYFSRYVALVKSGRFADRAREFIRSN